MEALSYVVFAVGLRGEARGGVQASRATPYPGLQPWSTDLTMPHAMLLYGNGIPRGWSDYNAYGVLRRA